MTIYKHKLENDVQPKNSDKEAAAVLTDDDEVCTLRVRIHTWQVAGISTYLFHL